MLQVGTFEWFQAKAAETAIYPEAGSTSAKALTYATLGLTGEAGEVANQVKKVLRDDGGALTSERREKLKDEIGDTLWYLARAATEAGLSLDDIARHNIKKLALRQQTNQLRGDQRQA